MRDYQRELQALRERIACCQEDRNVLNALLEQERVCREEMERCRAVRDKEQRDVDRLEGVSLASLLASLRGDRDERMDKERAEACAAALRYEAARRQLDEVLADAEFRRRRIADNRFAREEYDRLLEEKAAELAARNPAAAEKLRQIEQLLTELTDRRRELQEAIFAGETVEAKLRFLLEKLDSAAGWSTFDLMGGGLLADMAKYSHLDEAQKLAGELQSALRRYEAELADVTISADFRIEVGGFLTMADVWFDNIFTDWAVRDHIRESESRVRDTRRQVEALQEKLRSDMSAAEEALDRVRGQWRQTVEQL
ncbi:hypothetical protein [Dysosmobacter sp.]|uniref:hypothetical protein n=1 Tax=Dysosmobacter sp. TaxID=2591382 RepID=UPI002A85647F|nr:hypothetical protein [Dysosmobacter sp.]MDY3282622.1 hypothetical protein [Dysosmobacter sp.]